MSKVLFTHSYFYKFDTKQWDTKQPYPPLGTLYAASFLRYKGISVSLFDTNLTDSVADIIPSLEREKPEYLVIYDDGFNYLTKMCLTKMREAAFELCALGKDHNCIVIVSGSDSMDHYENYLDHLADFIITGEGEITLNELIHTLESGVSNFDSIDGLIFRRNGITTRTKKREILQNLDLLPFPALDLVDIEKYISIWVSQHGYFSLNVATTRGCPFKCNWCAKPIYGTRYNSRTPTNVADELQILINQFGASHFWFCDDIFGLKPGWIMEFRDIVKQRGLKFRFKIQSRVDLLLNENTIDALYESGVDTVWIGAESGSQKILDAMDKGTSVEQIYKATRILKKKNIRVALFIQLGYLGETNEDINKTIAMIKDLLPDDIGISVSYPLPGTRFYEIVKNDLTVKTNWSDSDDLAMMFRSTFPPQYYKLLHRHIHNIYRLAKSLKVWKIFLTEPFKQNLSTLKTAMSAFYYMPRIFLGSIRLWITRFEL